MDGLCAYSTLPSVHCSQSVVPGMFDIMRRASSHQPGRKFALAVHIEPCDEGLHPPSDWASGVSLCRHRLFNITLRSRKLCRSLGYPFRMQTHRQQRPALPLPFFEPGQWTITSEARRYGFSGGESPCPPSRAGPRHLSRGTRMPATRGCRIGVLVRCIARAAAAAEGTTAM